jgi:tRNA-modifying protein YgfZ
MKMSQCVSRPVLLEDHAVLHVAGPDARKFLQGQVSQDLRRLSPGLNLHAGLHTPQGRLQAWLVLQAEGEHDVLLLLPASLADDTLAQLRRYVLRAKLTLQHASQWQVVGVAQGTSAHLRASLVSAPDPGLQRGGDGAPLDDFHAARMAAGLPCLVPALRGHFTAQMLNLDLVGGVAFDKGCYTGQEIIARAHYLGRVKRRLQRFAAPAGSVLPAPGESLRLADGRRLEMVEHRDIGTHREVLAVGPLPGDAADSPPETAAPAATVAGEVVLALQPLPLPYAWPD